jgi:hypothetical protein
VHLEGGYFDNVRAADGVEPSEVLMGFVVILDAVATRRGRHVVDILENNHGLEPSEVVVVLPAKLVLVELGVGIEAVQQVPFFKEEAVDVQKVLHIVVQVIVFHQLPHELLDSGVGLDEEHLFLREADRYGDFRGVVGAKEFEETGSFGSLTFEI